MQATAHSSTRPIVIVAVLAFMEVITAWLIDFTLVPPHSAGHAPPATPSIHTANRPRRNARGGAPIGRSSPPRCAWRVRCAGGAVTQVGARSTAAGPADRH